jgi:hypothetical protein
MKDLKGHQVSLLETLNDIDTFEDLQRSYVQQTDFRNIKIE